MTLFRKRDELRHIRPDRLKTRYSTHKEIESVLSIISSQKQDRYQFGGLTVGKVISVTFGKFSGTKIKTVNIFIPRNYQMCSFFHKSVFKCVNR